MKDDKTSCHISYHQPQQHPVEPQRGSLKIRAATPGFRNHLSVQPDLYIAHDLGHAYKQQAPDRVAAAGLDFGLMHLGIGRFNNKTFSSFDRGDEELLPLNQGPDDLYSVEASIEQQDSYCDRQVVQAIEKPHKYLIH